MKSSNIIMIIAAVALLASCSRKLPKPDHIIIVMEENHGYDEVIGSPNAPFITELSKEGAFYRFARGYAPQPAQLPGDLFRQYTRHNG